MFVRPRTSGATYISVPVRDSGALKTVFVKSQIGDTERAEPFGYEQGGTPEVRHFWLWGFRTVASVKNVPGLEILVKQVEGMCRSNGPGNVDQQLQAKIPRAHSPAPLALVPTPRDSDHRIHFRRNTAAPSKFHSNSRTNSGRSPSASRKSRATVTSRFRLCRRATSGAT